MCFYKAIEKAYRKTMFVRRDPDGTINYFSADDFDGLNKEPFSFMNAVGERLCGYFYSYDTPVRDRLVVFDHGMGAGHRAYLKEISLLAKHGFLVFTYDHTGCDSSEGETMKGFSGSLSDLDHALGALKSGGYTDGREIYVMGHSWGGFSTMNIALFHPDVKKIVAMSGFESVAAIQKQFIRGILSPFRKKLFALERSINGKYAEVRALESLANMSGEGLIIHSRDDKTVSASLHFDLLREALSDKKNLTFLALDGKDHNPNYTREAIALKDAFFNERKALLKKKKLSTDDEKRALLSKYDWHKMTEQDPEVWQVIFDFLDK